MQPLSDLRILDLTQGIIGPAATRLLADFGADVLKVELPGGDWARAAGPFPGDRPHAEKSGLFLHLNLNKRNVVLDLEAPAGLAPAGRPIPVRSLRRQLRPPADQPARLRLHRLERPA